MVFEMTPPPDGDGDSWRRLGFQRFERFGEVLRKTNGRLGLRRSRRAYGVNLGVFEGGAAINGGGE